MDLSVYLLPHQDDETFVIPKIRRDLLDKKKLIFIFLTRNHSEDVATIRKQESRYFLSKILHGEPQILDLGEDLKVFDGELFRKVESSVNFIKSCLSSIEKIGSIEIISPAYEGGHQDHDAAFIIAQRIKELMPADISEYFMYNGYGTSGKFYKVVAPLHVSESSILPFRFMDRYYLFLVIFIYRSQLKSMLGLWPFMWVKSFFYPLVLKRANSKAYINTRDIGVPLYERWGRVTKDEFIETVTKKTIRIEDNKG